MKRDKNLETLSWEHHDGLVVVFRLEKGLRNKTHPKIMVEYLLHIWDHALQHHFWQEEQTIKQHLQHTQDGKKLIDQMLEEHTTFKNMIEKLYHNDGDQRTILSEFAQRLNGHIRFEERELFPAAEEIIPNDKIIQIGKFLHEQHQPGNKEWDPKFWQD